MGPPRRVVSWYHITHHVASKAYKHGTEEMPKEIDEVEK